MDECYHILALNKIMKQYEQNKDETINLYCDTQRTVQLLDHFNHLLLNHETDDDQFERFYELFNTNCDPQNCKEIKRHYRNRDKEFNQQQTTDNETDSKQQTETQDKSEFVFDLFSQLHCHIYHQYDVGFRISKQEQKQIKELEPNKQLTQLRHILKTKQKKLEQLTNKNRYSKNNRFSTNLNQSKKEQQQSVSEQKNIVIFIFVTFLYKDRWYIQRQEIQLDINVVMYLYRKYKSLKEELLSKLLPWPVDVCELWSKHKLIINHDCEILLQRQRNMDSR